MLLSSGALAMASVVQGRYRPFSLIRVDRPDGGPLPGRHPDDATSVTGGAITASRDLARACLRWLV